MFGRNKNSWKDQDEYAKARHAYEGQGVAATKAARYLGIGLVVMSGIAAVQTIDKHDLANLGNLKMVVLETNRTTGDAVSINMVSGELMLDDTKKRMFLKDWIRMWRTVPNDEPAFSQGYLQAQVYMDDAVGAAVGEIVQRQQIPQFIRSGGSRMVTVSNVTPMGNGSTYQVDWEETTFKNNRAVGPAVPMTANIDLEQHAPKTDVEAEANMFGLLIRGFRWTPPAAALQP